jgi:hypothetical protein
MEIVKLEHIPDGQPVTTAKFNALVDAINAVVAVIEAQGEMVDAQRADKRIAHRKDNRQAKPR